MKRFWLSACMTLAAAICLVVPAEAQKGKGKGKAGGNGKGNAVRVQPNRGADVFENRNGNAHGNPVERNGNTPRARDVVDEPDRGTPARSFAHPKSGNTLPQEVRDRLPPGLRDKPADHPGVVNHLRKMGLNNQGLDPLPADVRSQLPPGLRDKPFNHPGVANHLGKMGWRIGDDGTLLPPVDPIPAEVRRQLPVELRDRPYDDPGVANYLGRMGWTIADDGRLVAPPRYYPEVFPEFRPFGGFFRRW